MNNTAKLLKELTSAVGVSGAENEISALLTDKLSKYGKVETDAMNNVICTFGEGYHFLLDAHIDEVGLIVTDITDDGFVKFEKCGGIDLRKLPAFEVEILGKERINGIISTKPPHLQSDDEHNKAPKLSDLSIDTGYTKIELENKISLGDRIIFKRNFTELLNSQISSSCLDDRSGVASILMCIDELKKIPCKITVLFSSQEEVGTRGAKTGAYGKDVNEAISVDVSFAYTPGCDSDECGKIGAGAMIGFSPILDKTMSKSLVETAEEQNISYQCEIMNGKTGTNADMISISEQGIKTALISIPEKYMHQSVEVVDTNDVEAVSKLICEYIKKRVGEVNA
ncbi:MAG: M20/M25/M40 family metallo-hydrolase [Acetobacter sp.]|nr:M20/M25/M40 family metallo-hydrolase [Bacteroides sp.]MCM1340578.1 M20/M25/M40 family metallo-hydrolase [Acetobacter sp.]MCM1433318.1 M20/M25/M40 family metallo-hydrolase [Clostridiales bacterium]